MGEQRLDLATDPAVDVLDMIDATRLEAEQGRRPVRCDTPFREEVRVARGDDARRDEHPGVVVVGMDSMLGGQMFAPAIPPGTVRAAVDAPVVREVVEDWLRSHGGHLRSDQFIDPGMFGPGGLAAHATGVEPWMVVVLIAREFLITSIRGLAESKGIDFRADWAGKIKMFIQSFAVAAVLVDLAVLAKVPWVHMTARVAIWTTVVVTVLSTTTYVIRARKVMAD